VGSPLRLIACANRDAYYPPFPSDVRQELIDYYRPGIQDLERLLDRDLSFWLE
jgi:hypothetical protein